MASNDASIPQCPTHGMQGKVNRYYAIGVKVHANDTELWLRFFDNTMSKLTTYTAAQFEHLPDDEQSALLTSLCGTQLNLTLSITKQDRLNIRIRTIDVLYTHYHHTIAINSDTI